MTHRPRPTVPTVLLAVLSFAAAGCSSDPSEPEVVWGKWGVQDGDLSRPRAIAIDSHDRLYIVDFTARIQVYDRDGNYLGKTWSTPDYRNGRPSGLSIDRDDHLICSDSHYHCFRIYSADGKELRVFGGQGGSEPGQLGYVSDVVQDAEGCYYIAEFGENHRISKFDGDGKFIKCWGSEGSDPGQLSRARALALGPKDGYLYVADSVNCRIQVFTRDGELVRSWGEPGDKPGQLKYPYDLAFDKKGDLYVVELGNDRIQKFTADGKSLGTWGGSGREPGRLNRPWALALDSRGVIHVVDTENHRVQRVAPW
ncbi:MAG TPA: NHL repeat-containing protein [Gemmataceae bacterium]|nr:NHL repeat-containing protein [Gemmataceae bacterium]